MNVATKRKVNTLEYDATLCSGCGMCASVCPHGVFALDDSGAVLARPTACIECGACQLNCPTGAITVDSGAGCATAMLVSAITGKSVSCGGDGAPGGADV